MLYFILNVVRLVRAVTHGVRHDEEFRGLLGLLLITLLGGVLFYRNYEGWTVVDSLYFCVMTISTVGYGDLTPSNSLSRVFTIVYALMGIGVFAATVSKIVIFAVEQRKGKRYREKPNKT